MPRLTKDDPDSLIGGVEFRARRAALGLERQVIMDQLGVNRSSVDKWTRGDAAVPRQVRELIEQVEDEVEATIEYLADTGSHLLLVEPQKGWPWGEGPWLVVIASARRRLVQAGVHAKIGPEVAVPSPEIGNIVDVDFSRTNRSSPDA
ncbi:hypothetical protein [Sphingomonas yantingensis]|uniref:Transcriptional regulator with XRE-family HTH domain n=1 Tax=Sphingomonas yantingensis TaxID=1241761 RepID=A0A7W9AT17_9SPHN|nr:hypothetical protein [Sphingomonas yantingensis]MBB5700037.1 transcriptional regulator with XRE-family HTH domain [Sphingomonas yantingensis]